jgi:hypothetical protein
MIGFPIGALFNTVRSFRSAFNLNTKIRNHCLNDIGFEPDHVGTLVRFLDYSRNGHKNPYKASKLERRCQRSRPDYGPESDMKVDIAMTGCSGDIGSERRGPQTDCLLSSQIFGFDLPHEIGGNS